MATQLDEGLYSRQLYVLGHEGQARLSAIHVLVIGLGGLGVEVAKNIALAGVARLSLCDDTPCTEKHRGANFYVSSSSVSDRVTLAAACLPHLAALNPYVRVDCVAGTASDGLMMAPSMEHAFYEQFSAVICTAPMSPASLLSLSAVLRDLGKCFIVGEANGVFAWLFNDFGASHVVSDATGEAPHRGLVAHITNGPAGIVSVHEDARHQLSDGDCVTFEEVQGMSELNHSKPRPIRVISPYSFAIEDTSAYGAYTGTKGYFQQVKQPVTVSCRSWADELDSPTIANQWERERLLHLACRALQAFRQQHARSPQPDSEADALAMLAFAKAANPRLAQPLTIDEPYFLSVSRCVSAVIGPQCALLGGVMAQEALKFATGKFMPILQWQFFDSSLVLPSAGPGLPSDLSIFKPRSSRYDDLSAVIGWPNVQRLQASSWFVVGAGAIGCEMLKNLALLGVGRVHVTDMDTIEKSNLNRQFLFRPSDVGQLKSATAAREAQRLNPDCRIDSAALRVGPATENIYDDAFWESLTGVVTALDNVEARLYVDQRCVYYGKPMIDSGTLGTKGSVQVCVPHASESYGASRDPPEENIPICLLKHFPNKIEHTIQWARDHFEGLFKLAPADAAAYLNDPTAFLGELAKKPNEQLPTLAGLKASLVDERPADFADCVRWARQQFESEFAIKIRQLLAAFPEDSKTSEGAPFWSGAKRPPRPIDFDLADPLHCAFLQATAILRAHSYSIAAPPSSHLLGDFASLAAAALVAYKAPPPPAAPSKIPTTEAEAKALQEAAIGDYSAAEVAALEAALPRQLAGLRLRASEFEKDDDANFHMDFVTATSNLRARNYAIKEADKHATKLIAGKIIPAIATTTALVTGAVCLELLKLVRETTPPLAAFRNFSCNLALPLFASAEPAACLYQEAALSTGVWRWSLWDRLSLDCGDCSLGELLAGVQAKWGLEVSMLSYGSAMLYFNFGMPKKKLQERLAMRLTELIEHVAKVALPASTRVIALEACVNNEQGDEVEIPFIACKIKQ